MSIIVDNIELDKNNIEFNNAAEFVRHTDKLVYLTGKAGTGKTTFLKYIKNTTEKNTVILAPTGVAAINAGGVTIHSFFQIPFGPFIPNDSRLRTNADNTVNKETIFSTFLFNEDKRNILKSLELLIIDEISMVRADLLDVIDKILRVYRRKPKMPFGGVQVILIGDTFQLPPIADTEQWEILSQFYKTPFFFSSKVIEEKPPLYIELKKIYRQNEQEFIDLLNRVRVNKLTRNDFQMLNAKYSPTFSGNGKDYVILATHNRIVNDTNLKRLDELETEIFMFEAKITGNFPDKHKPTDQFLKLKVGAQIMFIKNDVGEFKRFFNGKIGKIKSLEKSSIIVTFDDESEFEVERTIWENIQYTYNKEKKKVEEEVVGTFEQFPIRLAWAITVHKSQGLTFEKVIADLGSAFAPGQVYVALSRCTSFNGLQLKTQITQYAVKTDPRVIEFAKNETPGTLITQQLNTGKADFYYKKAREQFFSGYIDRAYGFFQKALKFRNDIEASEFQRFVEVQGKRLFNYKNKYKSATIQLEKLKNDLSKANQEISEKNEKIIQQNSTINKLTTTVDDIEKMVVEQNRIQKVLESEICKSDKSIDAINSELSSLEMELKTSNKKNEEYMMEIQRLKNLKWYDKLIGKG
ncbi:AAA family ATPase [Draconibacterium sediminis]|uniref:AAA family ATPase n=1 Tax=Draconibacterium sediminis TaxID=1544798 RepID=UPI0026EB050E|nr:AAA family ATPase [Draconibacterium sediminis]